MTINFKEILPPHEQVPVRKIILPYEPRKIFIPYHKSRKRFSITNAHRRAGKTVKRINKLIMSALASRNEEPRFGYIAPFLKQAKTLAWSYLKKYMEGIPSVEFNESELRCDFLGKQIRLYGADNPDSIRGGYFDGVVLDEYAFMRPKFYSSVIAPMLIDRQGWADFSSTPNGHNDFYDKVQEAKANPKLWDYYEFKASQTHIIPPEELEIIRSQMSEEEYQQEFECSFEAAIIGSYYGRLIAAARAEGRIGDYPHVKGFKVYTAWDIGVGDATSIVFWQNIEGKPRIIDFYTNSGFGAEHYVSEIRRKQQEFGYDYGGHNAPHDVKVREWGTGKSRLETVAEMGIRFNRVPNIGIEDGIEASRVLLKDCTFNAETCFDLLEALSHYRKEYNEERKVFNDKPLHDWASDPADAFRYFSVCWKIERPAVEKKKEQKELILGTDSGIIQTNISIMDYVQKKERQRRRD